MFAAQSDSGMAEFVWQTKEQRMAEVVERLRGREASSSMLACRCLVLRLREESRLRRVLLI